MNQRDLVPVLKKEILNNIHLLSKLYPLPSEFSRQITKDGALDKPTQQLFNNLSHYLACVIDSQKAAALTWPLYDTKAEKKYRTEFSDFIQDWPGEISPVMSSYFVNPGCNKIIKLMFQLSQLAVQKALHKKMSGEIKNKHEIDVEKDFKNVGTKVIQKINVFKRKYAITVLMRRKLEQKLDDAEEKLKYITKNLLLDKFIDSFLSKHSFNDDIKFQIDKIKVIEEPAEIFDKWLECIDEKITEIESQWDDKILPILDKAKQCRENTETILQRYNGLADKDTYMLEFNPNNDNINTNDLEMVANSQQRFILKNIVKDGKLIFPNLVRSYLISISFILKNVVIGDNIYEFNNRLEVQNSVYSEMMTGLRALIERIQQAESKLKETPDRAYNNRSMNEYDILTIPSLPDLSDIKACGETINTNTINSLTNLKVPKRQFKWGRVDNTTFLKPQPKTMNTPYQPARDEFLKMLMSCRTSSNNRPKMNMSQNISVISQNTNRGNETFAESSGFTKSQIQRLLSTKKTSSSKKHRSRLNNSNIVVKKCSLFNESTDSVQSGGLFRSHSSPNLFGEKDNTRTSKSRRRKLSVMQEYDQSLLEVSGIAVLDTDKSERRSIFGDVTPGDLLNSPSLQFNTMSPIEVSEGKSKKILQEDLETKFNYDITPGINLDSPSPPQIVITPIQSCEDHYKKLLKDDILKDKCDNILKETEDLNKELSGSGSGMLVEHNFKQKNAETVKEVSIGTPNSTTQRIERTSSIEKIINRYKKVRASVLPDSEFSVKKDIKTISEEKENRFDMVNMDMFPSSRVLLPDLLSEGPS